MGSQKPEAAWPLWCSTRSKEPSLTGASTSHRGVKTPRDTSFNSYWSLWAPWPARSPGLFPLSLLSLFYNRFEGRRLSSLVSCIFSFHPSLREELKGAASSSSHKGNLLANQALPSPSSDAMSCRRTSKSNWPTEPRRQEPHYQQDDFTELRTAQQPLFPVNGRGTKLGLIIIRG